MNNKFLDSILGFFVSILFFYKNVIVYKNKNYTMENDNKDGFKTTLYPSLEIDEGMLHLINKGYNNIVYLKGEIKSFYISEVQKINQGNRDTINIILDFREEHVRKKIFNIIQKNSVYILYGDELIEEESDYLNNIKKTTTREVVCLYIKGCSFCPGMYYIKEENGNMVNPSFN